ncbi:MAG: Gfo/Idh/MocA family oxidoreductase [bacterium]
MNEVRLGIIGVGSMGGNHACAVLDGKINRLRLAAVSDINPRALEKFADPVRKFTDNRALIQSGEVDAVLIATPHFDHTPSGIAALAAGLHVLVEKPISVHKADAERLIAAWKGAPQVFAAMFNQRTDPQYQRIRRMIQAGELGELQRVCWTVTSWFRPQAYYNSGGWRATWKGEGGGVLLNQCPHNLDLLQWLCGMPVRVRGFCGLGKRHQIEVEDEATAYLEYANGATGVFITGTGEAPGTNRLEICGDRGRLVLEDGGLRFTRNEIPAAEFLRTTREAFGTPPVWHVTFPDPKAGEQHIGILRNFTEAILDGAPLLAPAAEGLHSVELANAMLYSSLTGQTVELPLDSAAYEACLQKLIRESRFSKP